MKKVVVAILAIIIAASMVSCGQTASDKNAKKPSDTTKVEEVTDNNGNITGSKKYSEDGSLKEEINNSYNDDGSLKSSSVITYDGDEVIKEKITEHLGDSERVVDKDYNYNGEGTVMTSVTKDGKKTSETLRNKDDSIIYSTTFDEFGSIKNTYDGNNITKSESFNNDGKLVGYTDMKFDENGKSIGSETFNADGVQTLKTVYEYKGEKISKILMYNSDGTLYRTGVYDDKGSLTLYEANGDPVTPVNK